MQEKSPVLPRCLTVGLLLAGVFCGVFAPPAQAASSHDGAPDLLLKGPGWLIDGGAGYGESWLGALAVPGGLNTYPEAGYYCIQTGPAAPRTTVTQMGAVADPALAYLAWKYHQDATADSRAAIAYLFRIRHDIGTAEVTAAQRRAQWEQTFATDPALASARQLASSYLQAATSYAGPYSAQPPSISRETVSGIGIAAASGVLVPGITIHLRLVGATFTDTGSSDLTLVSATEPLAAAIVPTASQVQLIVQGLAPPSEIVWGEAGDGTQMVAASGNLTEVAVTVSRHLPAPFTPVVTSDLAGQLVLGGDLVDVLHVAAIGEWVADTAVDFTVIAYGPFPDSLAPGSPVPPTAPIFAQVKVQATAAGDLEVNLGKLAQPGHYTVVVSYQYSQQSAVAREVLLPGGDFQTEFFDPRESGEIVQPGNDLAASAFVVELPRTGGTSPAGILAAAVLIACGLGVKATIGPKL